MSINSIINYGILIHRILSAMKINYYYKQHRKNSNITLNVRKPDIKEYMIKGYILYYPTYIRFQNRQPIVIEVDVVTFGEGGG